MQRLVIHWPRNFDRPQSFVAHYYGCFANLKVAFLSTLDQRERGKFPPLFFMQPTNRESHFLCFCCENLRGLELYWASFFDFMLTSLSIFDFFSPFCSFFCFCLIFVAETLKYSPCLQVISIGIVNPPLGKQISSYIFSNTRNQADTAPLMTRAMREVRDEAEMYKYDTVRVFSTTVHEF